MTFLALGAGFAGGAWWMGGRTEGRLERALARHETRLDEIRRKHTSLDERLAGVEPAMKRAIERVARSVYVVAIVEAAADPVPLASAWVVAPAILATNAHVAEVHGRLTGVQRMVVRSSDPVPMDFEVERAEIHPGYAAFDRLWKEHEPLRTAGTGTFELLRGIPACDVGLLHLRTAEGLAEPLPIASSEALATLASGDTVGFAGYPTEAMAIGGVNVRHPTPTAQVGHVTAVTDFFLGKDIVGTGLLVQHSLPIAGGASGSPVVLPDGRVVAVLSAGNLVMTPAGRIATGAGVNFAQRVDLVLEMLAGIAETAQVERTRAWEQSILQFPSLRAIHGEHLEETVERLARRWGDSIGKHPVRLTERTGALTLHDASGHRMQVSSFPSLPAGAYLFVAGAMTHEADIDLYVEAVAGDATRTLLGRDEEPDGYPAVSFDLTAPADVEVTVVGSVPETPFTLRLYAAE